MFSAIPIAHYGLFNVLLNSLITDVLLITMITTREAPIHATFEPRRCLRVYYETSCIISTLLMLGASVLKLRDQAPDVYI